MKSKQTVIYAIQAGEDGPIKIGITASIQKRFYALQSFHYETLFLRGLWLGNEQNEQDIHSNFASFQIRSEWFNISRSDLDSIGLREIPIPEIKPKPPKRNLLRKEKKERKEAERAEAIKRKNQQLEDRRLDRIAGKLNKINGLKR